MEAFHSFWSAPNACRNHGEIVFPDYEQLTAILSAMKWRSHSGKIRMITDTPGAAYFREKGLTAFWSGTETYLDSLYGKADPFAFWAAGKLAALKTMDTPCVMLDTDLILWENVEQKLNADVVAAHAESLNPRTYPDRSVFQLKNGYAFPQDWDFRLAPANTAFLFIRNAGFRDVYVEAAFCFLETQRQKASPRYRRCVLPSRGSCPCAPRQTGKHLIS